MTRAQRCLQNLFAGWFQLRRRFPTALLDEMTAAIAAGERHHRGEVRIALESRLAPLAVWQGGDATARARQVFTQLRVWDTEHNNGVLLYVLLAERRIEIVADRGLAARVTPAEWDAVRERMGRCYARGQWREGTLQGIAAVHALLVRHFPADGSGAHDELPDQPALL
jgi:uncharacterized membrane protein